MSSNQEDKLLKVFEQLGVSALIKSAASETTAPSTTTQGSQDLPPPPSDTVLGSGLSRAEKLQCITGLSEALLNKSLATSENFSHHLANGIRCLIGLCDDTNQDVRIAADEAINKTVKTLPTAYNHNLLYDFFIEIRRNGPARCLSCALRKFGNLASLIKPSRCKMYAVNLLPVLEAICQRDEESIQESLLDALPKIAQEVFRYVSESDIKEKLLKLILPRLHSESVGARRAVAELVAITCRYARHPYVLINWLVQILVDILVPVDAEHSATTVHGILLAIRHIVVTVDRLEAGNTKLSNSDEEDSASPANENSRLRPELWDTLLELCLFYAGSREVSVTTGGLEALVQLLKTAPRHLIGRLTRQGGFTKTTIYRQDVKFERRSAADLKSIHMSKQDSLVALPSESTNDLESDDPNLNSMVLSVENESTTASQDDLSKGGDPSTGTVVFATGSDIDNEEDSDDSEDSSDEKVSLPEPLHHIPRPESLELAQEEDPSKSQSASTNALQDLPLLTAPREGTVGQLTDTDELPVVYLTRSLAQRYLLAGEAGKLIPDRQARVSIKVLSVQAIARCVVLAPQVLINSLLLSKPGELDIRHSSNEESAADHPQLLTDIFLYCLHDDPQLKGHACLLVSDFLRSSGEQSFYRGFDVWMESVADDQFVSLTELPCLEEILCRLEDVMFEKPLLLADNQGNASGLSTKLCLQAVRGCANTLLASPDGTHLLPLLRRSLSLARHNYRLVRKELLSLLAGLDYRMVRFVEHTCNFNKNSLVRQSSLQDLCLSTVLDQLLQDSDPDVRSEAVETCCQLVHAISNAASLTQVVLDTLLAKQRPSPLIDWSAGAQSGSLERRLLEPLLPGLESPLDVTPLDVEELDVGGRLESSLHIIVSCLTKKIMSATPTPADRNLLYGSIAALGQLIQRFPVGKFPLVWGCINLVKLSAKDTPTSVVDGSSQSVNSVQDSSKQGKETNCLDVLLTHCLTLMTSAQSLLDIQFHIDILQLTSHLLLGCGMHSLTTTESLLQKTGELGAAEMQLEGNSLLAKHCNLFLHHLSRLLSIFWHIMEDQTPTLTNKVVALPSLSNQSLSPLKKKKGKENPDATLLKPAKEKELFDRDNRPSKSKDSLGYFYTLTYYLNFHDTIKVSYQSFKISPDLSRPDKTMHLLAECLDSFCRLLELVRFQEVAPHTQELLAYLTVSYDVQAISTVRCTGKLLRAIFGTNLSSQWDSGLRATYLQFFSSLSPLTGGSSIASGPGGSPTSSSSSVVVANGDTAGRPSCLGNQCLMQPLTQFKASISPNNCVRFSSHLLGWLRRSGERRAPAMLRVGKADKPNLGTYIRLFEPIVIRSLRHYSLTSCQVLQSEILNMLCQLIHLRVNYCQLDSEQRFLSILMNQFEQLEHGQLLLSSSSHLLPHLFHFLVLLSYERASPKSKDPIIPLSNVLHLAETLLASGLDEAEDLVLTSLQHLVVDLLVHRARWIATGGQGYNLEPVLPSAGLELEAQRECLITFLLQRLLCRSRCFTYLTLALQASRESEERWLRLSREILDSLLPQIARGNLYLDTRTSMDALRRLLAALAPSVFNIIDPILKIIFAPVEDRGPSSLVPLHRWSGGILALLQASLTHLSGQEEEDLLLSKISDLQLTVTISKRSYCQRRHTTSLASTPDVGDNDLPPETILTRLLFQLVGILSSRILENSRNLGIASSLNDFLCDQLSSLLFTLLHIFNSEHFRRTTQTARQMMTTLDSSRYYSAEDINSVMFDLIELEPYLPLLWCQLLTKLGYQDKSWWSKILGSSQLSPGDVGYTRDTAVTPRDLTLNGQTVRQAAFIVYCQYACEHATDAEKLSWIIMNHTHDLIRYCADPIVLDLMGAIHRNSAASGLFIQAFNTRCNDVTEVTDLRLALRCMEGLHLGSTGRLLKLLVDRFLTTPYLALVRRADSIAAQRVEMLLAQKTEHCLQQLSLADLDQLLSTLNLSMYVDRFPVLVGLFSRLRDHMKTADDSEEAPARSHPKMAKVASPSWFLSRVSSILGQPHNDARLCARLLQTLNPEEIVQVLGSAVSSSISSPLLLDQCLRLGFARTLGVISSLGLQQGGATEGQFKVDRVFAAAESVMMTQLSTTIAQMECSQDANSPTVGMLDLCTAINTYLRLLNHLPIPVNISSTSYTQIFAFFIYAIQYLHTSLYEGRQCSPLLLQQTTSLLIAVLTNPSLSIYLTSTYQHPIIQTECLPLVVSLLHGLVEAELVEPLRCDRSSLTNSPDSLDLEQMSHLLDLVITGRMNDKRWTLRHNLKVAVIGLARLDPYCSSLRLPHHTPNSSVDLEALGRLDRDQLASCVCRFNLLGWTDRKMFEETWMAFLAVLNPMHEEDERSSEVDEVAIDAIHSPVSPEELVERAQSLVTGLDGVTRLLLETMSRPEPGNPLLSRADHRPRDTMPNFLHTRLGRTLSSVHSLVEEELHDCLYANRLSTSGPTEPRCWNLDREADIYGHGHGQISVDLLVRKIETGSSPTISPSHSQKSSPETNSSLHLDVVSCLQSIPILHHQWLHPNPNNCKEQPPIALRSKALQSAVLLADLFTAKDQIQWLVDAILAVSTQSCGEDDLIQVWLVVGLAKCMAVLESMNPGGRDASLGLDQAIRWTESSLRNPLASIQDAGLHAAMILLQIEQPHLTQMHNQVIAYLERALTSFLPGQSATSLPNQPANNIGPGAVIQSGISMGVSAAVNAASAAAQGPPLVNLSPYSAVERHQLTVLAASFFYCERHSEALRETDLLSALVATARHCILGETSAQEAISTSHPPCSPAVYLALFRGLERLLLTGRLPRITSEVLMKLSLDRLRCAQSSLISLPAIGLFLTCAYTSVTATTNPASPHRDRSHSDFIGGMFTSDPEAQLVALERVSRLYERLRSGQAAPREARLLARLVPAVMHDFFPEQQTLNKTIAEFVHRQHAYPVLAARLLYEVFSRVMADGKESVVQEWVLLSLRSLVERTPLNLAVWGTTVFLLAASNNTSLRASFPICLSRLGRMEQTDVELLCLAGVSFATERLTSGDDRDCFLAALATPSNAVPFKLAHAAALHAIEKLGSSSDDL